jgi:hypothetical protein
MADGKLCHGHREGRFLVERRIFKKENLAKAALPKPEIVVPQGELPLPEDFQKEGYQRNMTAREAENTWTERLPLDISDSSDIENSH